MNGGVGIWSHIKEYLEFLDIYEWESVHGKFPTKDEHNTNLYIRSVLLPLFGLVCICFWSTLYLLIMLNTA